MPTETNSHAFDEWFLKYTREASEPLPRAKAQTIWNALLATAIEHIAIAKDQLVFEGEYDAALVARDVQQIVTALQTSGDNA